MRIQPTIKMADVKPETLKLDTSYGIYVNFQRNSHIFCIEKHSGTNVSTGGNSRWVIGKSKIAACNRIKWIYTTNLPQILTLKSIRISPVTMLDAKYVGISLLSCIQTEIHVIP